MVSPRQLAYRDRFVWLLEQVVSSQWEDCDGFENRYVFPDMTTRVPFVLYLSQQEFTTLYSAVLTGADLSYPETSHDVEMLFLQMVACAMNELCTAMANCITNSEATQLALKIFLTNNNYTGGTGNPTEPQPESILGQNLLPEGYVCTDDLAFGMALAIVDGINEAVVEVLQAIEILTNPMEIAAEMADNMPGVSLLTTGADIANWIQDTAKENYDLAWSTSIRDELACLLWCEFKTGCELSFDTVWNLYLDASQQVPPEPTDLESWLIWLVGLPYGVALQTVSTVSLLGLLAMRYGGKFGEFVLGIRSLEMLIKLAEDESSSDWSILCDCGWCILKDYTVDDGGFVKRPTPEGAGTWIASGWQYEDIITPGGQGRRTVNIQKTFTSAHVTSIDLFLNFTLGSYPAPSAALIFITEDATVRTDVLTIQSGDMPEGTGINIDWSDPAGQQMDLIGLFARSSWDPSAPYVFSGDILYRSLEVCGDGPEPGDL